MRTLEIEKKDSVTLALRGRFDASQVDVASEAFAGLTGSIALDFSELNYISSLGLGKLIALRHRLAESSHTLKIQNANPHIREVFKISALESLFIFE